MNALILPETIDRGILFDNLLAECAEMEILYPQPETLKIIMSAWSAARLPQWERMIRALNENYNPLHNYDRYENWNDTDSSTGGSLEKNKRNTSGNSTEKSNASENTENKTTENTENENSENHHSSTNNTEQTKRAGFDSPAPVLAEEKTGSGTESGDSSSNGSANSSSTGSTNSNAESNRNSASVATENAEAETTEHSARQGAHTGHLYGNIGVTTSATMLKEEIDTRKIDMYQIITQEFKARFCLMIY